MVKAQPFYHGEPALPEGFHTIEQLLSLPRKDLKRGCFFSVIAYVKDFQPPIATKGSDYKCTFEIVDHSAQSQCTGMRVIIFWPLERMPMQPNAGDVIVIKKAKAQVWSGCMSLLANKEVTTFYFLPASEVSRNNSNTVSRAWRSYSYQRSGNETPSDAVIEYTILANEKKYEIYNIPSPTEFEAKVKHAKNTRDKFKLLKDVQDHQFCDLIGEVIKTAQLGSGCLSMYLSDYTHNDAFYDNVWVGNGTEFQGKDGDRYGCSNSKKSSTSWPGPFGKMSIQLTLWDANAEFTIDKVRAHDWVLLRNVHVRYGKNSTILEGNMHGEPNAPGKIQVKILEQSDEPEANDERWKEAVRRKRDWWKNHNKMIHSHKQALLDESTKPKNKRKRKDKKSSTITKKQCLKSKRLLNENVDAAFPDRPIVSFKDILAVQSLPTLDGESSVSAPFTNCKYKATVRVVDYFPNKIEDFAVKYRKCDYDMLSDNSEVEDTYSEQEVHTSSGGKGVAKNLWEWRFALQLEDASSGTELEKERIWVMVDNQAAQGLLGLEEDASDLHADTHLLACLREQLFKLWGDLEEKKSEILRQQETSSTNHSPSPNPGAQPDIDSDAENEPPSATGSTGMLGKPPNALPLVHTTANQKPFTCCLQQYGVRVHEEDAAKADAGNHKRWQRMFGLFGTTIK